MILPAQYQQLKLTGSSVVFKKLTLTFPLSVLPLPNEYHDFSSRFYFYTYRKRHSEKLQDLKVNGRAQQQGGPFH